jgi:hypothetical protein
MDSIVTSSGRSQYSARDQISSTKNYVSRRGLETWRAGRLKHSSHIGFFFVRGMLHPVARHAEDGRDKAGSQRERRMTITLHTGLAIVISIRGI